METYGSWIAVDLILGIGVMVGISVASDWKRARCATSSLLNSLGVKVGGVVRRGAVKDGHNRVHSVRKEGTERPECRASVSHTAEQNRVHISFVSFVMRCASISSDGSGNKDGGL